MAPQVKKLRVTFSEVGRRKLTWTAELPRPLTEPALIREIRNRRALLSHDIECHDGHIYVGMIRRVGSYRIEADGPQTETRTHDEA